MLCPLWCLWKVKKHQCHLSVKQSLPSASCQNQAIQQIFHQSVLFCTNPCISSQWQKIQLSRSASVGPTTGIPAVRTRESAQWSVMHRNSSTVSSRATNSKTRDSLSKRSCCKPPSYELTSKETMEFVIDAAKKDRGIVLYWHKQKGQEECKHYVQAKWTKKKRAVSKKVKGYWQHSVQQLFT